jgi:hypothetical protein
MQAAYAVRFPEALRLRAPAGMNAAVEAAARRHHTSGPEWIRQALLRSLQAEGLRLSDGGEIERVEPQAKA